MSKRYIIVLLSMAIVFMLAPLQAQDLNFTGAGARAAGMGNAFTGVADDASAISWNSAGLTQLYSMEASVVGRFGFGSYEIDIEGAPDIEYKSNFDLNFASFAIPFSVGKFNVVGGVAYRTFMDFNNEVITKWDTGDITSKSEGGVRAISPAIAVQLNEMFSVGVALNIYTGSQQSFYTDAGNPANDKEFDKEEYSGSGLDIGVLIKPNSKFSIGANLNLPNTLKYESNGEKDEIKVPFFFSVGAGFRATDNFLIAVDYLSRNWSNSDSFEEEDDEHKDRLDLNSFHIGLEYLLISGNAIIPLRAGFYTSPQFKEKKAYDSEDQLVNNVITFGAGLILDKFIIDGAFEIEPSEYAGVGATLKQNRYRVTIGATIHFGD